MVQYRSAEIVAAAVKTNYLEHYFDSGRVWNGDYHQPVSFTLHIGALYRDHRHAQQCGHTIAGGMVAFTL